MSFNGKRIWITGASAGIGEALAYAFAREGGRLVLSARRADKLAEVVNNCDNPEQHSIVPLDLSEKAQITTSADTVLGEEPVDLLVCNGGISQRSLALETKAEVELYIMEVNYFATVTLSKAVARHMVERGSGHIVIVSSLAGKVGAPFRSTYAASKHALHGFFDVLRNEIRDRGVSVTLVCPGFIKTEISINAMTADGSPQGTMDAAQAGGVSARECAQKIVESVRKNRQEVYIGGREVAAVYLKRFFPGLLDRILRKRARQ